MCEIAKIPVDGAKRSLLDTRRTEAVFSNLRVGERAHHNSVSCFMNDGDTRPAESLFSSLRVGKRAHQNSVSCFMNDGDTRPTESLFSSLRVGKRAHQNSVEKYNMPKTVTEFIELLLPLILLLLMLQKKEKKGRVEEGRC
jgi:hypothetical protein